MQHYEWFVSSKKQQYWQRMFLLQVRKVLVAITHASLYYDNM